MGIWGGGLVGGEPACISLSLQWRVSSSYHFEWVIMQLTKRAWRFEDKRVRKARPKRGSLSPLCFVLTRSTFFFFSFSDHSIRLHFYFLASIPPLAFLVFISSLGTQNGGSRPLLNGGAATDPARPAIPPSSCLIKETEDGWKLCRAR